MRFTLDISSLDISSLDICKERAAYQKWDREREKEVGEKGMGKRKETWSFNLR